MHADVYAVSIAAENCSVFRLRTANPCVVLEIGLKSWFLFSSRCCWCVDEVNSEQPVLVYKFLFVRIVQRSDLVLFTLSVIIIHLCVPMIC